MNTTAVGTGISSSGVIGSLIQYKSVFQIAFALGMLFYWAGVLVIVYHLIKFGTGSLPKTIMVIFLIGSIVLSVMAGTYFFAIFKPI